MFLLFFEFLSFIKVFYAVRFREIATQNVTAVRWQFVRNDNLTIAALKYLLLAKYNVISLYPSGVPCMSL